MSRGEGVFREVMQHPERVSEFVNLQDEWTLEDMSYAANRVYERLTGQNLWQLLKTAEPYPLTGYDWLLPDRINQGDI